MPPLIDDTQKAELEYSNNTVVDAMIRGAVNAIKAGKEPPGAQKMIKTAPTEMRLASPKGAEGVPVRYQVGSQLTTYTGVDKDGNPIKETWGGGVADIKEDSVILRSPDPIRYPEGQVLAGQPVKGTYQPNGEFKVDQTGGQEVLHNEYVSDTGFVKGAYGIDATSQWQTGFKLDPSYAMTISESVQGDVVIKSGKADIHLKAGDSIVIDTKKGEVKSVHGVEKTWMDKTYTDYAAHMQKLKQG